MVATIIVAAGSGRRMGGALPKQFLEIEGEVILMRTIRNFSYLRGAIVVVLGAEWVDYWQELCAARGFEVEHRVVVGGAERSDSVRRGLEAVEGVEAVEGAEGVEVVLVQDGVRPFASKELINRTIAAARAHGAAVPTIALTDTIRTTAGQVVDRNTLRAVQTPQGFLAPILQAAYAQTTDPTLTDDAQVVQAAGHPVVLVDGAEENIKITTPLDIKIATTIW